MKRGRKPGDMKARFMSHVTITDWCWLWEGTKNKDGYGRFYRNDLNWQQLAHRTSYEMFVGAIPDGLVIDHLCSVHECVRPDHLEAVTHRENVIRAHASRLRKLFCKRGHTYRINPNGVRVCPVCPQMLAVTMKNIAKWNADPASRPA